MKVCQKKPFLSFTTQLVPQYLWRHSFDIQQSNKKGSLAFSIYQTFWDLSHRVETRTCSESHLWSDSGQLILSGSPSLLKAAWYPSLLRVTRSALLVGQSITAPPRPWSHTSLSPNKSFPRAPPPDFHDQALISRWPNDPLRREEHFGIISKVLTQGLML